MVKYSTINGTIYLDLTYGDMILFINTYHMMLFVVLLFVITNQKLEQVFSLFRHGTRFYETSIGNLSDFDKSKFEQLTSVGMRKSEKLGSTLRQQYILDSDFINKSYKRGEIEGYTTKYNRTIMTLESIFYGLYPLGTGFKLSNHVNTKWYQPPYKGSHQNSKNNQVLQSGYHIVKTQINETIIMNNCPNRQLLNDKNLNDSKAYKPIIQKYDPFLRKLALAYQINNPTFQNFYSIYDKMHVDRQIGRNWPQPLTQHDFETLRDLMSWKFYVEKSKQNQVLINSGKFIKMFEQFDNFIGDPTVSDLKWTFSVGHDSDMLAMNLVLNFTSVECLEKLVLKEQRVDCGHKQDLDFLTSFIFELHSKEIDYYVRVRKNGKYMKICGDQQMCNYQEFKDNLQNRISSNIEEMCGRKINSNSLWDQSERGSMFAITEVSSQ